MGETVPKAVEGDDAPWRQLAIERDVERQVHQGAHEVAPEQGRVRPPRECAEEREQFVRVQHQHGPSRAPLDIVAEEGARPQVTLPLDHDVVREVIEVDEEAAHGDAEGHLGRPRQHR